MNGQFRFALGMAVKVPGTGLTGTIVDRTAYEEAEPSYLIAWEDDTGPHSNPWSENSIEAAHVSAEVQP